MHYNSRYLFHEICEYSDEELKCRRKVAPSVKKFQVFEPGRTLCDDHPRILKQCDTLEECHEAVDKDKRDNEEARQNALSMHLIMHPW